MSHVVDSSIWVDCLRPGTSETLRRQTMAVASSHDALLCEPVLFELLRAVPRRDRARTEALLATVPLLSTPDDLWPAARKLGQQCVDAGFLPPAIDLLIAQICIHHGASLTTFDRPFAQIARISGLQVQLLARAA